VIDQGVQYIRGLSLITLIIKTKKSWAIKVDFLKLKPRWNVLQGLFVIVVHINGVHNNLRGVVSNVDV
jgi:hypothetical protein